MLGDGRHLADFFFVVPGCFEASKTFVHRKKKERKTNGAGIPKRKEERDEEQK
jgi:hypothetical protein